MEALAKRKYIFTTNADKGVVVGTMVIEKYIKLANRQLPD